MLLHLSFKLLLVLFLLVQIVVHPIDWVVIMRLPVLLLLLPLELLPFLLLLLFIVYFVHVVNDVVVPGAFQHDLLLRLHLKFGCPVLEVVVGEGLVAHYVVIGSYWHLADPLPGRSLRFVCQAMKVYDIIGLFMLRLLPEFIRQRFRALVALLLDYLCFVLGVLEGL